MHINWDNVLGSDIAEWSAFEMKFIYKTNGISFIAHMIFTAFILLTVEKIKNASISWPFFIFLRNKSHEFVFKLFIQLFILQKQAGILKSINIFSDTNFSNVYQPTLLIL